MFLSCSRVEQVNIIKRAFEIAPECGSVEEVKRRLIREGYLQVNAHLSGWQIRRELKGLIDPARKKDV